MALIALVMALVVLRRALVTLWRNYLPWTQAVVVAPLIANARRPWVKAAWISVLVATTAVFAVQSGYLVKAYFEYRTTTQIRLIYEPEATFPAVTFCNLNPFKKSTMENSQELTNLVLTYAYVNKMKQVESTSGIASAGRTAMTNRTDSHARKKRQDDTCTETVETYIEPTPSRDYSLWHSPNGTEIKNSGDCNVKETKFASDDNWKVYLKNLFYFCSENTDNTVILTDFQFDSVCGDGSHEKCGVVAETVFDDCDYPQQTGNGYTQSFTHKFSCTSMDGFPGRFRCKQNIRCASVPATGTTTSEPPIPSSTTPEITTTTSTSTFETTAVTSTPELSTTTTDVLQTTTTAETTSTTSGTSKYITTTTEPETSTSMPLTSTQEPTTTPMTSEYMTSSTEPITTASATLTSSAEMSTTTTDDASARSSTLTTATFSEGATTTTDAQISESSLASERATTTTQTANTSTTTKTSTTPEATTAVESSSSIPSATSEKIASFTTSTTVPDTPTTSSHFMSTTASGSPTMYMTTSQVHTTSSSTLMQSTTAPTSSSSAYTTSARMITTSPLAVSSFTTETSTKPQATTKVEPRTTEHTSTTSKKTTSRPTSSSFTTSSTVPDTTRATAQTISTTPWETSTAYPTTVEAHTTSTGRHRLPSTTTLSGDSSTDAAFAPSKTTRRELETSTASITSTTTNEQRSSTSKTSTSGLQSMTLGSSARASSSTVPTDASSYSTTVSTTVGHSSTHATDGSVASSGISITETTRVAQEFTVSSSSMRATEGSITTASAEGAGSLTPSQSATTPANQASSMSSLFSTRPTESSTDGTHGGVAGTTYVAETSQSGSSVTPTFVDTTSVRTTKSALTGSPIPSNPTEMTTMSTSNDATTATHMPTPSSPQTRHDTWRTATADGNGNGRSTTTLNVMVTSTANSPEDQSDSAADKRIGSTSSPGGTGDARGKTSYASASLSALEGSTVVATSLHTPTRTDVAHSIMTQTGVRDRVITSGTDADNFATTPSVFRQTEPTLGGGQDGTTMPVVDNLKSTTRHFNDPDQHATAGTDGNSSGKRSDGTSSATATTSAHGNSFHPSTKQSNAESDAPNADHTTEITRASGSELTSVSHEDYLKNIKLNLSLDFDLKDLSEEQKKNFKDLSTAYGLDPSQNLVLVDANMKQALQAVAAKMSTEERQIVGFQLKELVSSCIMNGEPCDTINDFKQTFDVDYGNCYTFNYGTHSKYVTKRAGSSYGLRMTIFSNSTEAFPSSTEEGVKIVVHDQDIAPFPNVEGHRGSVGQAVHLQLTRSKVSKLGAPHGQCSTLESVARNKQPFYYNGSYTTEGCFRSCFQRNIATACGCADSRFPSPTDMDVPFCDPLEPAKYKCKEAYVEENGDYHAAKNCSCFDACEVTAFKAEISESPWPAGGFFYGRHCPLAEKQGMTCGEYYRDNAMRLEVSYAQLGFGAIGEEPAKSAWALFNDLVGNSGLWIGFTMPSLVEIVLVTIQICLWICGVELPEVPSLMRLNPWAVAEEDSDSDEWSDDADSDGDDDEEAANRAGASDTANEPAEALGKASTRRGRSLSLSRLPPKNFDNSIFETGLSRSGTKAMSRSQPALYDQQEAFECIVPVLALANEHPARVAQI